MTPLEQLQERLDAISKSDLTRTLIRNIRRSITVVAIVAAFIAIVLTLVNLLYAVIGGWALVIGAVIILGALYGAIVTAIENT